MLIERTSSTDDGRTARVSSMGKAEKRKLLRQKLKYKRNILVGIWAIAFTYLTLNTDKVASAPNDLVDTRPLSRNLIFSPGSSNWELSGKLIRFLLWYSKYKLASWPVLALNPKPIFEQNQY